MRLEEDRRTVELLGIQRPMTRGGASAGAASAAVRTRAVPERQRGYAIGRKTNTLAASAGNT